MPVVGMPFWVSRTILFHGFCHHVCNIMARKSEFLEASPHPVLSGHESISRNRKICCCCIHISCLRVGSPAVVLQSVSTCHKTFRQVSCFLSIFSITHIKCRESQKLGPLDSCWRPCQDWKTLRPAPFPSIKPLILNFLCAGKEHSLTAML